MKFLRSLLSGLADQREGGVETATLPDVESDLFKTHGYMPILD